MKDEIKNVTLSFPCSEDWEKFDVVPGGRLCHSCKYIVRDFRDCSMTEFQEVMKSGKRVCGRFKKDQISPLFLKAAAAALAITTMASCESELPKPVVSNQTVQTPDDPEFMGDIQTLEDTITIELGGIIIETFPDSVNLELSQKIENEE
jgi:hypothetical protein